MELTVHRACEESKKQVPDGWIAAMHQVNTLPVEQWPSREVLQGWPIKPRVVTNSATSERMMVFTGAGELTAGVAQWERGMHAALYREWLAPGTRIIVLPPVPGGRSDGTISPNDWDRLGADCIWRVGESVRSDRWHGILAWGGTLRYRCCWDYLPGPPPLWHCSWTLLHPGVMEWSETVMERDYARPWHGCYQKAELPEEYFRTQEA